MKKERLQKGKKEEKRKKEWFSKRTSRKKEKKRKKRTLSKTKALKKKVERRRMNVFQN